MVLSETAARRFFPLGDALGKGLVLRDRLATVVGIVRDLVRLLLTEVPAVCLFVRTDNLPAIALYESIGMEHVLGLTA